MNNALIVDPERKNALRAIVYGAAVGDALGVPFEFLSRDTFRCDAMVGGGTHRMPCGTLSDDTSMLIATAASITACGDVDICDMQRRFRSWLYEGAYTPDGRVFDVGNTTATALDQGFGCSGEYSNGNGSLMRIAPLAILDIPDARIEEVSAITHAHDLSKTACVVFVRILQDVLEGVPLASAIEKRTPADARFAFMKSLLIAPRAEVRSRGYVLDTLGAALWCALHTDDYASCAIEAVNLGEDTDTTACVAGALAGALYGFDAIPSQWVDQLRGKDVIEACLPQ